MHGVGPSNGFGAASESPRWHLAFFHQPGHRADRVFDRRLGVHTMLIVEIDHLYAETPEARLAGGAHVIGSAVDALMAAVGAPHVTDLGGEHDLVPAVANGAPYQFFIFAHSVHIGGVSAQLS